MRLFLFGQVRLEESDGTAIRFRSRHEAELLAMLTETENSFVLRSELIERLWPDAFGESGRANLRNALSGVRKAVGKSGIIVDGDRVGLADWVLEFSDLRWDLAGDYRGDFMPGFQSDWVLDLRLKFREKWVDQSVRNAQELVEAGDIEGGLRLAEEGFLVDGLHQECSELYARLLEQVGKRQASVKVVDQHRGKVLQSLGLDSDIGVERGRSGNGLAEMAEWLIERNPADALEFFVASGQYWPSCDVSVGLTLHERVLALNEKETRTRREVVANQMHLEWAAGVLGTKYKTAERHMDQAFKMSEFGLGYRFGVVGMYGRLSAGDFKGALRVANTVRKSIEQSGDSILLGRAAVNVGIIYQHSGRVGQAKTITAGGCEDLIENGSGEDSAGACLVMSHYYAVEGRLNKASELLAQARRYFVSSGAERGESWVDYGEAEMFCGIGELGRAMAIVNRINERRPAALGHSLVAAARDLSGRIHYELGEFDEAAFNLMGSRIWREELGVKASIYERRELAPAWVAIRERLSRSDLLRAYERARNPRPGSPN